MKISKALKKAVQVASVVGLAAGLIATPVLASTSNGVSSHFQRGVSVTDDFNDLYLRPDSKAYWYTEAMGVNPDGSPGRLREVNCGLQTCVQPMHDATEKFVRLEDHPFAINGYQYINANMSEDVDGADGDPVYGGQSYPGAWNPTVDHPVIMEARVRYSANVKDDGSGGAKGTAGIVLWDNPFSQQAPYGGFSIYDLVGFTWISDNSVFINGLHASVVENAFPVNFQNVANPNMSDWNTYKIVWSTDASGNQNVDFYLNGTLVASAPLPAGVLSLQNLGVELWFDNQQYTFTGVGTTSIQQNQYMDVDYVTVSQL